MNKNDIKKELVKEYVADRILEMSQLLTEYNFNNAVIVDQIDDLIASIMEI